MLAKFTYQRAESIPETLQAASAPAAHILAGGTDLLGCLRDGVFSANRVVSISGMQELKDIKPRTGGGFHLGALATVAEIAGHAELRKAYPVLTEAALSAASPQLRNQGTLGGQSLPAPAVLVFPR